MAPISLGRHAEGTITTASEKEKTKILRYIVEQLNEKGESHIFSISERSRPLCFFPEAATRIFR